MQQSVRRLPAAMMALALTVFCLLCIIPIVAVVSISLSNNLALAKNGYSLFPRDTTLAAYRFVFKNPDPIIRSYSVSILTTSLGCVLGLAVNAMMAYPLARTDYRHRGKLTVYLTIPMVLNGGLIPTYILITRYLQLKNTLLVLILPMLVVPWFIILLRTFFSQIPHSLVEAATIDGAGEMRIFLQIILPLAKPALATVGMFITLNYWNDWFLPLMYIDKRELQNVQYKLYVQMLDVQELIRNASMSGMSVSVAEIPTESMRMAMCVITAGPMLMIFPFFQKYFVKGLTLGGVKG